MFRGPEKLVFNDHPRGASASLALYSLIETAKANGLKPYFYLRFLFVQLAETEDAYRNLLPQNLSPNQIALPAA